MSRAFYGLSIAVLKSGSCRVKVELVVRLIASFLVKMASSGENAGVSLSVIMNGSQWRRRGLSGSLENE